MREAKACEQRREHRTGKNEPRTIKTKDERSGRRSQEGKARGSAPFRVGAMQALAKELAAFVLI